MFSLIIPVYNAADSLQKNLPGLIEYFKAKQYNFEVIIVDDGSCNANNTKKIAEINNCHFLKNEFNQGKGAAVRKGMLAAKGDFKIFTDADIPFEFTAFDLFLNYLDFKGFDIVIGDRTLPDSIYFKEIPTLRHWSSKVFTFIVGRFITTGLFDTQCGLKGFRKEIADDLFSVTVIDSFTFDVELLYVALKRNYDIKRIPVKLRSNHPTSLKLLQKAPSMLWDIISLKINHLKGIYDVKHK